MNFRFAPTVWACFLLPIAIGTTFPIQVISGYTGAGAASLLVWSCLLGLSLSGGSLRSVPLNRHPQSVVCDWLVSALVALSLADIPISWIAFPAVPLSQSASPAYLAIQAALMYAYFSRIASHRQIRAFFAGMVVMGMISGSFFVFESFNKLALGQISQYTAWAHEYSLAASGDILADEDVNNFRIDVAYRSFGLLERHSTSALWMILGCYASWFLATDRTRIRRAFAITLAALLVVQNFTALVSFLLVTVIIDRNLVRLRYLLSLLVLLPLLLVFNFAQIETFASALVQIMKSQFATALTFQIEMSPFSYSSMVLAELARFGREAAERPYQLLIGFGLGSNPAYGTSGDVGFVEAIMRLGVLLWLFVTIQIARLLRRARQMNRPGNDGAPSVPEGRFLITSAAILATTWAMDLHYSTWIHKSIFPILFFGLALARRASGHAGAASLLRSPGPAAARPAG